ncbi:MAG: cell division protein SepF [Lachnospirales bacterium]
MAEWFEKLKNIVMGEPDEYDEDYEEGYEEEYEDEAEEEPKTSRLSSFTSSFRNMGKTNTATAPSRRTTTSSQRSYTSSYSSYGNSNNRVLSIQASVNMQVVVATPTNLEEAGETCEDLKDKKTVVVNLEGIDREVAQRITDFFCGACYALDGAIQPVSSRIFIIVPYDVKLTGQFKQELEASGIKLPNSDMWR